MNPVENRFVPGAGTQPPELGGRGELLERARIGLQRVKSGRAAKGLITVGLRGVGKTVILNRIRQQADAIGYRSVLIEAHEQKNLPALLVPAIRRLLLDLDRAGAIAGNVKRGLRVLRGFMSAVKLSYEGPEICLDIDPETGTADSGDLQADLPELFAGLGHAAAARAAPVALFIDEMQYLSQMGMSALSMSIHRVAQVAEHLGIDVRTAGPLRGGLIRKGMIYSPRHGDTAFTVPLFHDFLARIMPDWTPPPRPQRRLTKA